MTDFAFPKPGERTNPSAIPVPERVLLDLVLSVLNGDANSECPGCAACDRWHAAAGAALKLLPREVRAAVLFAAQRAHVDILTLWGLA